MTEKEKMLEGLLYDPADPQLVSERLAVRKLLYRLNHLEPEDETGREKLFSQIFGRVGQGILIEPTFQCDYGSNIFLGDGFYANFGCVFLDSCPIRIGKGCLIGPQVGIYTVNHPLLPEERASGLEYGRPVTIGDQVWIGGHAVINPGVQIGDHAIIASGAVVTRDVPKGAVVAGNPAEIIRWIS